eukprot:jgi/Mesvir1/17596/Mv08828-RA.1
MAPADYNVLLLLALLATGWTRQVASQGAPASSAVGDAAALIAAIQNPAVSSISLVSDILLSGSALPTISRRALAIQGICPGPKPCTIEARNSSRVFVVTSQGSLTLLDLALVGGNADNGGAVHVSAGGHLTCTHVRLHDNAASVMGGAVFVTDEGSSFVSSSTQYTANSASKAGGAIAILNGARATLTGDSASGCVAGEDGGVAFIQFKNSSLDILNGTFVGNNGGLAGGLASVHDGGRVQVTGSLAGNNTAQYGAVLFAQDASSSITSRDCTFRDNTAPAVGGVMAALAGATLALNGDTLAGNTAGQHGGGIYVQDVGTVLTAADVTFQSNTAAILGGALMLVIGANTRLQGGTVRNNSAGAVGGAVYGTGVVLDVTTVLFAGNGAGEGGGVVTFEGPESAFLASNCTFEDNGSRGPGGAFHVLAGAKMVTNASLIIRNRATTDGGAISVHGRGSLFSSHACEYEGNHAGGDGGAAFVTTAGTLECGEGTRMVGNTAARRGGAVAVVQQGVVLTSGARFESNRAERGGGALAVASGSSAELLGASVLAGNTAGVSGGAVYAQDAGTTVAVTNGSILADNRAGEDGGGCYAVLAAHATDYGGGLYVAGAGSMVQASSTELAGNGAGRDGGGAALSTGARLVVSDSIVRGNRAGQQGGGLHGAGASTSLACDGCQWEGNQAGGGGGGMYLSQGLTASLNNSQVRSNQAAGGGGGVLLSTSAHLTLASTSFASNVAGDAGGGVALTAGASCLVNSGCMWEDNRAGTMGAALAIADAGSATIVTGATFLRNVATTTGGALAVSAGASCRLQEVSVGYNAAGTAGGGIAVGGSGTQLSVAGGSLDSNRANTSGGGVALASGAAADLDGTRLVGNAAMDGGAVSLIDPATQLRCAGCSMSNNNALRNGGAVFADASLLALDSCTLEGNLASLRGGALFLQGGARCSVLRGRYLGNAAARGGGRVVFAMGRGTVFLSQNSSFSGGPDPAEIIPGSVGVRFVSKDAQACSVEGGHFLGDGAGGSSGDAASMASFNCSEVTEVATATAATYAELLTRVDDQFIDIIVLTADISVADAIIVNRSVAISGASCGGGGGCRLVGVGRTRLFTVASYGELILANVSLSGGRAVNGGALHISAGGQAVCDQVAFSGNSAELRGGAVYVTMSPSSFTATKSVFVDNNATVGGAMAFSDSSRSTLQGVLVANCSAGGDGGGIHLDTAAASIIDNSHVVTCVAGGSGGGLMVAGVGTSVRLVSSVVQGNGGKGNGAGMVVSAGADIEAEASNFVGNVAGGLGGGVRLVGGGTRAIFTGARFLSNRAAGCGGALSVSFAATLRLDSCLLDRNAGKCGGGLHVQDARTVARISNSTFIGNNATDVGGGVSAFQGPSLELQSCHLSHNRAGSQGGAMFGQGADTRAAVLNSTFASNAAGALGGAVALQSQSVWSGEGALFAGNAAGDSGGALAVGDIGTEASCDHCKFHYNTADQSGAVAYLSSGSLCRFTASVFASNRVEQGSGAGGVARVEGSTTQLLSLGCDYQNNHAPAAGGVFFAISGARVASQTDLFLNNSAMQGAVAFGRYSAVLDFASAQLRLNAARQGAVFASSGSAFRSSGSLFLSNTADISGGALHGEDAGISSVADVFEGNQAEVYGGAVALFGEARLSSVNAIFQGNRARGFGGAVLIGRQSSALFTSADGSKGDAGGHCVFSRNSAESGGALYLDEGASADALHLRGCQCNNNSALAGGGGVLWARVRLNVTCRDGTVASAHTGCDSWSGNTARYGHNAATSAASLSIHPATAPPADAVFRSGQVLPPISVDVLDGYSQRVVSGAGALVSVDGAPPGLTGKLLQASVNGRAEFGDLVLSALPGTYTVSFASAGVRGTNVRLRVRACIPGEVRRASNACERCDPPLFSWRPQNRQCELCPPEAICLGGDDVLPLPGYWRSSNVSYEFHACLNENACAYPGREEYLADVAANDSATWRADAQCDVDQGYRGVLCAECAEGYGLTQDFVCRECPSVGANTTYFLIILLAEVFVFALLVKESLAWATRDRATEHLNAAVYVKLLVSYYQIMGIAYNYKVPWPVAIGQLLGIMHNVVSGGRGLVALECTFKGRLVSTPVAVMQSIYYAALPLVCMLILAALWLLMFAIRHRRGGVTTLREYFWRRWVISCLAAIFIIWPAVTDAMLQVFACYPVDREGSGGTVVGRYWESDMGLKCYTGEHFWLAFGIALPVLVLLVGVMPVAWILYMWHRRRVLGDASCRDHYGFLYQDFKPQYYYWEVVSMGEKFLLLVFTIFVGTSDVLAELLAALSVILAFTCVHYRLQPYLHAPKNGLQQHIWYSHCFTVALGLFYFKKDLTTTAEVVLGILFIVTTGGIMVLLVFLIVTRYLLRHEMAQGTLDKSQVDEAMLEGLGVIPMVAQKLFRGVKRVLPLPSVNLGLKQLMLQKTSSNKSSGGANVGEGSKMGGGTGTRELPGDMQGATVALVPRLHAWKSRAHRPSKMAPERELCLAGGNAVEGPAFFGMTLPKFRPASRSAKKQEGWAPNPAVKAMEDVRRGLDEFLGQFNRPRSNVGMFCSISNAAVETGIDSGRRHRGGNQGEESQKKVVLVSSSSGGGAGGLANMLKGMAAGGLAGAAVETALYPIDTIKTRLQAARAGKGLRWDGLYSGLGGNIVGVIPSSAMFFGVYEPLKMFLLKKLPENLSGIAHVTSAAAAGTAASLVRVPTEVIKQRMQTGQFTSATAAVRTILAKEGAKGLYSGYTSFLLRDLPFDAIEFVAYEQLKIAYSKFVGGRELKSHEVAAVGAVAGAVTGILTTPFDVVKTRMMVQGSNKYYAGTIDCIRTILAEEGAAAFFKGVGPRVLWIGIGGSIFFGVLEKSKELLKYQGQHDEVTPPSMA